MAAYTAPIPSGIYILRTNPSGATPVASGGYIAATGATGSAGIYAASGFEVVDNFFYAHTTGADYLLTGNPTNIALATGTGYVYGGDIRGTGDNYQMWGTATATGLTSQVEHFVGAYAQYTDGAGKTLTGLISGGNGYYTGSYTTTPVLYEFDTIPPDVDTDNLGNRATGSGVHLFRDVNFTFSQIVDRGGATLTTQEQLENSIFFDGFDIDILGATGEMVFSGYKSGIKSRTFTFTEAENTNIFGSYQRNFGIRWALQDQNGSEQVSEIQVYGNPLEIECIYFTDESGRYLNESNDSNFITTGTTPDELYLTNKQPASGDPTTGSIDLEFCFKNNPNYTSYKDTLVVYGSTSENFTPDSSTLLTTLHPTNNQFGQKFQLEEVDLIPADEPVWVTIRSKSPLGEGPPFTFGPTTMASFEQLPDNAGQPLYNRGEQYLDGHLDVDGYVTGWCLTVREPEDDYYTLHTNDGYVGIRTNDPIANDPTYPLTLVADPDNNRGFALFDQADLDNPILTLNGTANEDGDLTIYNNAGEITSQLFNDNDKGKFWLKDAGGDTVVTAYADGNDNGLVDVIDSAGNSSVKLYSDASKNAIINVYDSAGTSRVKIDTNSSNKALSVQGDTEIKTTAGNYLLSTDVASEKVVFGKQASDATTNAPYEVAYPKAVISAEYSQIASTGSVIVGGSGHYISGDYCVIAGGADNTISGGDFNFVGGGSGICIDYSSYSSSVGGLNNDIITGNYCIIAGGEDNLISGNHAVADRFNFIGGGHNNKITGVGSSVIVGGSSHLVRADAACIMGGISNRIEGNGYSIVGGGENNVIGGGSFGAILGGENNTASGHYSTIVGGEGNFASGNYAFIGGGDQNHASGKNSYAFGRKALVAATHSGAAVLADGQDRTHASSGDHTLNLDFASGVYIGGGGALYVSGNPVLTGENNPAEADTLQTVTDRGATTSNAISITNTSTSAFTVATNALFVDGTNDRVGIGTNSIGSPNLNVYGSGIIGRTYVEYAQLGYVNPPTDGLFVQGNVGIGTYYNTNKLDVHGALVVGGGGSYAGQITAPSNGLVVEGAVGIGTIDLNSNSDFSLYGSGVIGKSLVDYGATPPYDGLLVAGNVGIGTFSAANRLDVDGAVTIGAAGITAPSNGLIVAGDVGVGTSSPNTALDVRGTISGYTGLFNGRVGIGVDAATPDCKLDVSAPNNDSIRLRNSDGSANAGIALSVGSNAPWMDILEGQPFWLKGNDYGDLGTWNGGSNTKLYIGADDKIGIGTVNPLAELDVAGDTDVSGIIGRAHIGYVGDADYAGFSHVDHNTATNYALQQTSAGHTLLNCGAGDQLYFRRGDANVGGFNSSSDFYVDTDALYVDASEDRVGINEASPSYTLDVTASDASSLLSRFYNSSSTDGQGLLVRAGETSNANRIFQCSSRDDTKVMTVNSNGSVGVGTTTPAGRFDIVSSRNIENDLSDADNYHLHLHNNVDDTDESIGIGFGITSDTDALGACIGHERKGAASYGDLFFATRPDGGSVTERLRIASNGNVGIGTNAPANALDVVGHFSATSKSFVIDHPTKENKKLQYGSLEGPEHGVFVRGATNKNVIKLPDYWKDLVHEDSITVTLTPVHTFQSLYVKSKTPEQIMVGGVKKSYDYVVYGERKDIDKLEVEI